MTDTFLMCPPRYFAVKYVINPWMTGNIGKTDHSLANQQWQDFYHHITQYAQVELLEPHPDLPDLVFTANPGLVKDNLLVLSHFRPFQREPEVGIFEQWFADKGYETVSLPKDIFFEGGGDALFQPGRPLLWMGCGFRSDEKAGPHLESYFSTPTICLTLVDERFYHLDTCFCPLLDGAVMYFPAAFDAESIHQIEDIVPHNKRIIVSEEDALSFACNAVLVNTKNSPIIFMNAATSALKNQLETLGHQVILQSVKEFQKSGGANRCLTLQL